MRQDLKNRSSAFELPKNKAPIIAIFSVFICGLVILTLALIHSSTSSRMNTSSPPLLPRTQSSSEHNLIASPAPEIEPDAGQPLSAPRVFTRRISPRELRRLQRRNGGWIKSCYARAARRDSSLVATKASVTVNLAGGGKVKSIQVEAGDDRPLETCLRHAIRHWPFSSRLMAQQVSFPIVFRGR